MVAQATPARQNMQLISQLGEVKCEYVHEKNLLGGMYWDYAADNDQEELARTVYKGIMK